MALDEFMKSRTTARGGPYPSTPLEGARRRSRGPGRLRFGERCRWTPRDGSRDAGDPSAGGRRAIRGPL